MNYAAIIYNSSNIIVNVRECCTLEFARRVGESLSKRPGFWYRIEDRPERISLAKLLINA